MAMADGAGDGDGDGKGIESRTVQGQINLGVRLLPRPGWLSAFAASTRIPPLQDTQHRKISTSLITPLFVPWIDVIRNAVKPTGT